MKSSTIYYMRIRNNKVEVHHWCCSVALKRIFLTSNQIFIFCQTTMNALIRSSFIRRAVTLPGGATRICATRLLHSRSSRRIQQKPPAIFATTSKNMNNIITPFKTTEIRSEFFWKRIKQVLGMNDPKEQEAKEEAEFEKKFICKYIYNIYELL
jgi:hypothetical protein